MKITEQQLTKELNDAGLDVPSDQIVFPYGYRIAELDGRKVIMPLSKEELLAMAPNVMVNGCAISALQCIKQPLCKGFCFRESDGLGGYYCDCGG
ncbi:hypothetical protein [Mesorhizobium sp. M0768]|uniref:hypothetical protein n=1 Tax=Mesorhizobium sp. M0768 TaxID=2956996 RepID=UPI0033380639